MLQQQQPKDYVIATGSTYSLKQFVEQAFAYFNLDWRDHVRSDPDLYRPSELRRGQAYPARAAAQLGWSASLHMPDVVKTMCQAEAVEKAV
jgi:GDPmannose 4,6-dehydratase